MTRDDVRALLREYEFFDASVLYHGYRDYMRDYEVVIADIGDGPAQGTHAYLFRYCTEAHVVSSVSPEAWRQSTDDRLLGLPTGKVVVPHAFHWGIRYSEVLSNWIWKGETERAAYWSEQIGREFSEIALQTNAFRIELTFAELAVTKLSDDIIDLSRHPLDPLHDFR